MRAGDVGLDDAARDGFDASSFDPGAFGEPATRVAVVEAEVETPARVTP
jgi:hypothetical protein